MRRSHMIAAPVERKVHLPAPRRNLSRFAFALCCCICSTGAFSQDTSAPTVEPDETERAAAARKFLGLPADTPLQRWEIETVEQMNSGLGKYDKSLSLKGLNITYPSYGETVLGDFGGVRSALAEHGIGLTWSNSDQGGFNVLGGPRSGVGPLLHDGHYSDMRYQGQRLTVGTSNTISFTYDTGRWGVPDGQLALSLGISKTNWEPAQPTRFGISGLFWYQTMFDRKLELKIGFVNNLLEWVGFNVGGNFANPLGIAASIPISMGFSTGDAPQPTVRTTWHITDSIYNQMGLMRSLPMNGPTGNPINDSALIFNRSGLRFRVPNGGLLFANELGYKTNASPGEMSKWIRAGYMYNNSDFADYRKMAANPQSSEPATKRGASAFYLSGDMQVSQYAPGSMFTAYRGLYVGGSFMAAPSSVNAYPRYYEARAYIVGPFASRPSDQIALVYGYNTVSKDLYNYLENFTPTTGQQPLPRNQLLTLSYTAKVARGIYATTGLVYVKNPTLTKNRQERDNALNLNFALFMYL